MEPANGLGSTLQNEEKRVMEKDLIVWTASARPFQRKDRQFYITTFSIAGIIALVLFLAEGIMPVLLIVSLVFLYYILSTVEPGRIEYKVTNMGVKIAGRLTPWSSISRCWFPSKLGSELMTLEITSIPGRLELVLDSGVKAELNKVVSEYVPIEEPNLSGAEKIVNWVTTKLSGN